MITKIRIQRIISILIVIIPAFTWGQNCLCISGLKNKEKGIETIGGVTNTIDFYSLLIHKIINYKDTADLPKYRFLYHAATDFQLTDSMLNSNGTIELILANDSKIIVDSVKYENSPLKACCSIGFWFFLPEETIKTLSVYPIKSITANGIIRTSFFNSRKQREQQKIFNCLINRRK
ncbi:MAG: hypothetical protein HXX13_13470 [Bacteroidetes bacterium]|nr:hypothetical protein [Bacteroidota bacterium]